MSPTDEELLHAFYAGDSDALERMADRHDPVLWGLAYLILKARTGSAVQARGEWDISERLSQVWAHVLMTQQTSFGTWPHQRLSALTWLIHLLSLEMDRHLGLRGPF